MTLNEKVNLRFEQDDGVVWVFDGDSQFGTEISHLMMMHADEYNEDELRVICHHAACEIDKLRAELEKAKAQEVPEGYTLINNESLLFHAQSIRMFNDGDWENQYEEIEEHVCSIEGMVKASESGAEG